MSSDKTKTTRENASVREAAPSPKKADIDAAASRGQARHLQVVPDLPAGGLGAPAGGYVFETPDVIGLDRKRAEYRAQAPDITDD